MKVSNIVIYSGPQPGTSATTRQDATPGTMDQAPSGTASQDSSSTMSQDSRARPSAGPP